MVACQALETGIEAVYYALVDHRTPFGWHIRQSKRDNASTKRPRGVDYGIETTFDYFGFVLDPDAPGRADQTQRRASYVNS
jgi:hypothetical protein